MKGKRILVQMDDPIFGAGSGHTATVTLTVAPSGIACTLTLYLTKDSGVTHISPVSVNFTSTGSPQNVTLSVTMPGTSGAGYAYDVYLDLTTGTQLLGSYVATEKVTIPSVTPPVVTWS